MKAITISDSESGGSVVVFVNHEIQYGGSDGDGYCYEHQSFDCILNLSSEEVDATEGALALDATTGHCGDVACARNTERLSEQVHDFSSDARRLANELADANATIARLEAALEAACTAEVPDETIVNSGCCGGRCHGRGSASNEEA